MRMLLVYNEYAKITILSFLGDLYLLLIYCLLLISLKVYVDMLFHGLNYLCQLAYCLVK